MDVRPRKVIALAGNASDLLITRGSSDKYHSNLQKFASTHASFHNHFNLDRHINHRQTFKSMRNAALSEWRQLLDGREPLFQKLLEAGSH